MNTPEEAARDIGSRARRRDAETNRTRIIDAARQLLEVDTVMDGLLVSTAARKGTDQ